MLDVVSIGTVTADIFIPVPPHKKMRPGTKLEISAPYVTVGGGTYNTAVTFSKQGFSTGLFAKVGDDLFGRLVHNAVEHASIQSHVPIEKNGETGVSFILLSGSGERTILVRRGLSGSFSSRDIERVPKARWAYINPGSMPLPVLTRLIARLHAQKVSIAINPSLDILAHGFSKLRPILQQSCLVVLNREEAAKLTGISYIRKDAIFKALDAHVPGIILMTDGFRGASVSDGTYILHEPAFRVPRVVDVTGAGDAFGSGFASVLISSCQLCTKGMIQKETLRKALKKGAKNAGFVIQRVGATEGIVRI